MLPLILPPIIAAAGSLLGDVLKRVLPAEKISESERMQIEQTMTLELMKQDWSRVEAELKDRMNARELAAADIARGNAFTGILAATVRPAWGYGALVLVVYTVVGTSLGLPTLEVPEAIWEILNYVVWFFFGGRTAEKIASIAVPGWVQKRK
jgi:hypothetical protein